MEETIESGDKGSYGMPNRSFLAINDFKDVLIRKSETKAKLTELEMNRKQEISQARSIVEQYFGLSHLRDNSQPDSQREPKII